MVARAEGVAECHPCRDSIPARYFALRESIADWEKRGLTDIIKQIIQHCV
jgi:hypothetical protein